MSRFLKTWRDNSVAESFWFQDLFDGSSGTQLKDYWNPAQNEMGATQWFEGHSSVDIELQGDGTVRVQSNVGSGHDGCMLSDGDATGWTELQDNFKIQVDFKVDAADNSGQFGVFMRTDKNFNNGYFAGANMDDNIETFHYLSNVGPSGVQKSAFSMDTEIWYEIEAICLSSEQTINIYEVGNRSNTGTYTRTIGLEGATWSWVGLMCEQTNGLYRNYRVSLLS